MGMKESLRQAIEELKYLMEEGPEDGVEEAPIAEEGGVGECVLLSATTEIRGDVISGESISAFGIVRGSIETAQLLLLEGKVEGNLQAAHILLRGATVVGDVVAAGNLLLDEGTMVAGNLRAENATIAGHVKGDVFLQGRVLFKRGAYVMGNVEAEALSMEEGVHLSGYVRLRTAVEALPQFPEIVI